MQIQVNQTLVREIGRCRHFPGGNGIGQKLYSYTHFLLSFIHYGLFLPAAAPAWHIQEYQERENSNEVSEKRASTVFVNYSRLLPTRCFAAYSTGAHRYHVSAEHLVLIWRPWVGSCEEYNNTRIDLLQRVYQPNHTSRLYRHFVLTPLHL